MYRIILIFILCFNSMILTAAPIALFTAPEGWQKADPNAVKLPPKVQAMFVGKGPSAFPPSINLSSESYAGTLKQYLKIIKNRNEEKGYEWKDLGSIRTQSGQASLSQVDNKTQWGDVRLMHVILLKNGAIYIITASALKSEFSLFYQDFFKAMRSLHITENTMDTASDNPQQTELKTETKEN